jgi:hypothetical protein
MLKYTILVLLLAYVNSAIEDKSIKNMFHIFFLILGLLFILYIFVSSFIK